MENVDGNQESIVAKSGRYPKSLIIEVRPNKFGQVRQVKIEFLGEKGERIQLWRHVNKVALLESIDEHDPRIMSNQTVDSIIKLFF